MSAGAGPEAGTSASGPSAAGYIFRITSSSWGACAARPRALLPAHRVPNPMTPFRCAARPHAGGAHGGAAPAQHAGQQQAGRPRGAGPTCGEMYPKGKACAREAGASAGGAASGFSQT